MARTTDTLVRAVIEVDAAITDLTPFIDAAHGLVEAQCTDIMEAVATDVETWLAAHLITIRENRASNEKAGEVAQAYQYKLGLGLECSMYGQQAMMMDSTGGLARWNKLVLSGKSAQTASVSWLGTEAT